MKKLTLISIAALFTASAWAVDLSGTVNPANGTTYDGMNFTGDTTLTIAKNYEIENTGNISVAEANATITGVLGDIYLTNETKSTPATISGVNKDTSFLTFKARSLYVSTSSSSKESLRDLKISNITLTQHRWDASAHSAIYANTVGIENSNLVIQTAYKADGVATLSANGSKDWGNDTAGNTIGTRSYYFKNSSLDINTNAKLSMANGTRGIYFDNSTFTIQSGSSARMGNQAVIFANNSIFNYAGSAIYGADDNSKAGLWSFRTNTTVNVSNASLDLTQNMNDANTFLSVTFNLDTGSLKNTNSTKGNSIGSANIIGKDGTTTSVDFAYTTLYKSGANLDVSTTTSNFTTLDMVGGSWFRVKGGTSTVGKITAGSLINIDVVADAVLKINDFTAREGITETFKIALDDEIVKGALLVADEKIGTYASEEVSREYIFVDTTGAERVFGKNLFIEAVENGYFSVYTQVPEPASWAAILGALALGLVIYRKRK